MPAPNSAASQSECIIATFAQVISARPADTLEFNNDTYSIRIMKLYFRYLIPLKSQTIYFAYQN